MPVAPAPCGFEEASRFAGHFSGSFPLSRSTRPQIRNSCLRDPARETAGLPHRPLRRLTTRRPDGALMLPYAAVDRTSAGDATAPTG